MNNNNQLLHYSKFGNEGTPIVFIHGWAMNSLFFKKQVEHLAKTFQVYTIDLTGHGKSPIVNDISYQHMANDLDNLFTHLNLKNFVVAGWSMGMHVIWYYLSIHSNKNVIGLADIEMISSFSDDIGWAIEENKKLEDRKEEHIKDFIENMFYRKPSPKVLDSMLSDALKIPTNILQQLNLEMANFNANNIIHQIKLPCLLMFSKNLHFFSEEQINQTIELFTNREVFWFQKSKHCPFWEEPKLFNSILLKFIQSL